jgi:thioredoxin-like negative regulator of GroEL|tara:strand:+ start:219 stop:581 length:363 start_codon:yes stop_codon:yes gene_type:complete
MKIKRLSKSSLENILKGKLREEATCVVKFYSNGCHMCHKLKERYEEIAESFPDVHFFAFNIADYPGIQKRLEFKGVPTISVFRARHNQTDIKVMPEPSKPDKTTWYTTENIKIFIEKEKI